MLSVLSRRTLTSLLSASLLSPSGAGAAESSPQLATALPTTIPGLTHWFDASSKEGFVDRENRPVRPDAPGVALRNRVAGNAILTFPPSSANGRQLPTSWYFRGRMVGDLGGLGATLSPEYGTFSPLLDTTTVPRLSNIALGTDVAKTVFMVFSRPGTNEIPFGTPPAEVPLLAFDGIVILSISNAERPVLKLFPRGKSSIALGGPLAKRTTLSVTLRFSANGLLDVWLNDAEIASKVPNILPPSKSGTLFVLGDATNNGGGGFFHEMSIWNHALSPKEINLLLLDEKSISKKWKRGPRVVPTVLLMGQSNASFFDLDGGAQLLAEAARWNLGALWVNLRQRETVPGGTPLYGKEGGGFLIEQPGVDPTKWLPGNSGLNVQKFLASLSPDDRAHFAGLFAYYSEGDQGRNYGEKAVFKAAWRRMMALTREWAGLPAASVALMQASIPYTGDARSVGAQMICEVMAELAGNPAENTVVVLPNTSAVWGRGVSPAGVGGDAAHLDSTDNQRNARLAGRAVAGRIVASGHSDVATLVSASRKPETGPTPISAKREANGSILLTIRHDAGDDLLPPTLPEHMTTGWRLFNGYQNAGSMGTEIAVRAVEKVDATTLRVSVATPLSPGVGTARLFPIWGAAQVGRGGGWTDNASRSAEGRIMAAEEGPDWALDYPISGVAFGIPV